MNEEDGVGFFETRDEAGELIDFGLVPVELSMEVVDGEVCVVSVFDMPDGVQRAVTTLQDVLDQAGPEFARSIWETLVERGVIRDEDL